MSSRYGRKATAPKKKGPSGVAVCLKLNFGINNNERIQIAKRADTRTTTLSQVIHMAIDSCEDQSTKLLLQSMLNNSASSSITSSLVYMRTSIPRPSWDDTTLEAMGIDNASGGSVLLTLNAKVENDVPYKTPSITATTSSHPTPESTATDKSDSSAMDIDNNKGMINKETSLDGIDNAEKEEKRSSSANVMDVDATTPINTAEPVEGESTSETQQQSRPLPPTSSQPVVAPPKPTVHEALQTILNNNFDAASKECFVTLLKMLYNLLSTTPKEPKGEKFRTINLHNATLQKKVLSRSGSLAFFTSIGFESKIEPGPTIGITATSSSHITLLPSNEDRALVEKAASSIRLLLVSELGMHGDDLPKPPSPPPIAVVPSQSQAAASIQQPTFDIYKGHAFNVTAAAVGANGTGVVPERGAVSKIDSELKRLEAKAEAIQNKTKGEDFDRELVALKPGQQQQPPLQQQANSTTGGGTSDGALLAGRMKRMEEERQKRENGGLTTKAMRDLEKLKQTKVYQYTQIRICFPDGYSLNGKFHPKETIQQVKDVVSDSISLSDPPEFNLYVAPPPKVLDVTSTLSKEGLVPAARVHVSWKNNSGPSKGTDYIKSELFSNEASASFPQGKALVEDKKSKKAAAAAAGDDSTGKKKSMDEDALMERMLGKKTSLLKKGTGGGSGGSSGKPKWFKG